MKKSSIKQTYQSTKNINKSAVSSVRIIGGQYKRRTVTFIDAEGLRPTPDRLRETLFNWLLMDCHDARVLDSCAGSGVLGFEALSRGAAYCTFIEFNHSQSKMLAQSAEQLHLDKNSYHIIHGAAEQVLSRDNTNAPLNNTPFSNIPFNIVFIDPPYAEDLWQPILSTLITHSLINAETLIYLEADKDLTIQLDKLAISLEKVLSTQGLTAFHCIKHTKVGQVVAGLYQLSPS